MISLAYHILRMPNIITGRLSLSKYNSSHTNTTLSRPGKLLLKSQTTQESSLQSQFSRWHTWTDLASLWKPCSSIRRRTFKQSIHRSHVNLSAWSWSAATSAPWGPAMRVWRPCRIPWVSVHQWCHVYSKYWDVICKIYKWRYRRAKLWSANKLRQVLIIQSTSFKFLLMEARIYNSPGIKHLLSISSSWSRKRRLKSLSCPRNPLIISQDTKTQTSAKFRWSAARRLVESSFKVWLRTR